MSSETPMEGLPPLPKSLSSVNLAEPTPAPRPPPHKFPPPPPGPRQPPPPPPRKQTKLDVQLARLRKEMYSLREVDLSLLSQLWSLNESLQEFRAMQEMLSPPSDPEEDALYSNLPPLVEPSYPLSSSSSHSSNNAFTEL